MSNYEDRTILLKSEQVEGKMRQAQVSARKIPVESKEKFFTVKVMKDQTSLQEKL